MSCGRKEGSGAAGPVCAVIVTHNSASVIDRCLESLLRLPVAVRPEILVIDNASQDATPQAVQRFSAVRLVRNAENRGFAAAVNQGFRESQQPLVLVMNPDAELLGGWAQLCAEFDDAGVGAAAGMLQQADGRPQAGFSVRRFPTPASLCFEALGWNRLWPSNPINKRYRCLGFDWTSAQDVQQPAGAFLMIRRQAWKQAGGFDEGFHPVWFEEVDFLRRLSLSGWRIRYQPATVVRHTGGQSVKQIAWEDRQLYWYASLCRYSAKHFPLPGRLLVCVSVILGSGLRIFAGGWWRGGRRALRNWLRITAASTGSLAGIRWAGAAPDAVKGTDGQANPVELKGSLTGS